MRTSRYHVDKYTTNSSFEIDTGMTSRGMSRRPLSCRKHAEGLKSDLDALAVLEPLMNLNERQRSYAMAGGSISQMDFKSVTGENAELKVWWQEKLFTLTEFSDKFHVV